MSIKLKLLFILYFFNFSLFGQSTVGLTSYDIENSDGYVLFSPMSSTDTYLIDKCGEKVHEWTSSTYEPALSSFLLEDGSLLKTGQINNQIFSVEGGSGGVIERFDWNGNLTWSYTMSDSNSCLHHDIYPMANGNILCILWNRETKNKAVLNGKDPSYNQTHLWSEKIVEIQPVGSDNALIVWEWDLFDHLVQEFDNNALNYGVVSEHPELIDINYFPGAQNTADWIHLNSIDYNSELDQILLSSHRFNEVWILDHSTSTAEAATHSGGNAGKGGDLLYRWGNPQAYQRGNPTTKVFYGQHHATWIPENFPNAGNILVFNNGLGRPGNYSSIDMIEPPLNGMNGYNVPPTTAFLPSNLDWTYIANTPSDFYSSNISGVYPIENGSFMISSGASGLFFEIDSLDQTKWEYVNPVGNGGISSQGNTPTGNLVFRCNFYEPNYLGLQGQTLSPMGEIELNPTEPSICDGLLNLEGEIENVQAELVYPNPFLDQITVEYPTNQLTKFILFDVAGRVVLQTSFTDLLSINTDELPKGMFIYYLINSNDDIRKGKIIKAR